MHRFQQYLADNTIQLTIHTFLQSTKTAKEAADALGCKLDQIAKTIAFRAGKRPILVVLCGSNRVSVDKLAKLVGESVSIMTAEEVKQGLGYTIGGVPAFGYTNQPQTFIDTQVLNYPIVYSAAGRPNAVYPISPRKLQHHSHATFADLCL